MRKRTTIYTDQSMWDEFLKICEREGESASEKVRDFVARYVQIHRKGNPQMLLESFGAKKQVIVNCEYPDCRERAVYHTVPKRRGASEADYCLRHYRVNKRLLRSARRL